VRTIWASWVKGVAPRSEDVDSEPDRSFAGPEVVVNGAVEIQLVPIVAKFTG